MTDSRSSLSSELPQFPESLWRASTELPSFPRLAEDILVDAAIVGAGIAGVTTAYMLTQKGYKVALLDAGKILDGATGYTTAKVTAQHGVIYNELLQHFGEEKARQYYQANTEALQWMKQHVEAHQIDCNWEPEAAYVYADSEEGVDKLKKEFEAYQTLGIPSEWVDSLPIPLEIKGAIRMPDQARFNPLPYLKHLIGHIQEAGGLIYEETMITEKLDKEGPFTLYTARGDHAIRCKHVISTSHFPFYDGGGFYFTRLRPERSYVVAVKPETQFAGGMYINVEQESRSLRSASWNGEELVLVGGENHKVGQGICTYRHYENLEMFGGELLGIKSIPFRWSTQDLITLDKVPYIGQIASDEEGIYVATGFGKWGMTTSSVAAHIITDQLQGIDNPYSELYTPSRFKADPSILNMVKENANVAKEFISGKIGIIRREPEELEKDEGGTVLFKGKRAGAYRDREGQLHIVDSTCTHMGCEVEWNDAERSWDCPCHGSRFHYDGQVLEGPAEEPLAKLDQEA